MAQLDAHLEKALAGQGHVVFVTGGAGWGKTALIQAFARHAQEVHTDVVVAGGSCSAYTGIGDSYLPFRDILDLLSGDVEARWVAGAITPDHARSLWHILPLTIQALVQDGPDLINTFVPGRTLVDHAITYAPEGETWVDSLWAQVDRETADPGLAGTQQRNLFQQYTKVLRALAYQAPLLLMLDDLQWADLGSISLLFHLGRRLAGSRILILGAYRPEEVAADRDGKRHPLEPIVCEFQREFGDIVVELGRTRDRAFVEAFLETEPNQLGAAFRETLYQQTGGHPLFTVELLRGMQERGDLMRDEMGRWVVGPALRWETLPARVEAAIAERISRLPAALQAVLTVASVEGEVFTAEVLARVQATGEQAMVQCLSDELEKRYRLVRAQSVRRAGSQSLSRYRFRHYLFQTYLYSRLDRVERARLHAEVGNALETLYGDQAGEIAVQLAHHFREAKIADKATDYLFQAGERACRLYAYGEALEHFRQALALAGGQDTVDAILTRRASVLLDLFQGPEAAADYEQLLQHARESGHRTAELEALLGLARAYLITAYDQPDFAAKSVALLEQAYALAAELGDKASMVRSLVPWVEFCSLWPEYWEKAAANAEKALALSRELGAEELIADSTLARAKFLSFPEAAAQLEALREALESRYDLGRLQAVHFRLISTYSYLGEFEKCIEHCDAAIRVAQKIGAPPVQYPTFKALALMSLGRYDVAWEALQEEVVDEVHRLSRAFKGLGTGVYFLELMAYERAAAMLRSVAEQARRLKRVWLWGWALNELARSLVGAGRIAGATAVIEEAAGIGKALPRDIIAQVELAEGRLGEALGETAQLCAEAEERGMRDIQVRGLELRARILLGLGRADEAVVIAGQGLAIAEEKGYRPMVWRIRGVKAEALARLGESEAAAREYQAAATIIRQLAATIPDAELRRGFLSNPLVSSILNAAKLHS